MLTLKVEHLAQIKKILQQHIPDANVWAFGSRVTGNARKHSDLDIAIVQSQPLTYTKLVALKEAFSDSDLPIRVDIVELNKIDESFQKIIKEKYVVIQ